MLSFWVSKQIIHSLYSIHHKNEIGTLQKKHMSLFFIIIDFLNLII